MNVLSPMVSWRLLVFFFRQQLLSLRAIGSFFSVLFKQQELTLEMTKREFTERYAGQVMGVLWGVAHPVVVIAIYIFVFTVVFPMRMDQGVGAPNHALYLLAGLVPWMA